MVVSMSVREVSGVDEAIVVVVQAGTLAAALRKWSAAGAEVALIPRALRFGGLSAARPHSEMKNVQKVGFRAAHLVDDGIGRTGTVRGVNLLYLQERPMRWTGLLREELAGSCVGFFHWIRPSSSFLLGGRAAAGRRSGAVRCLCQDHVPFSGVRGARRTTALFGGSQQTTCYT